TMPWLATLTGCNSLSMMNSPHLAHWRVVRWLISSRLASEARAVLESSPFFAMINAPLGRDVLLMVLYGKSSVAGGKMQPGWEKYPLEVYHMRAALSTRRGSMGRANASKRKRGF